MRFSFLALSFALALPTTVVAQWNSPTTFPDTAPVSFAFDDGDGPVAPLFDAAVDASGTLTLIWSGQEGDAPGLYSAAIASGGVSSVAALTTEAETAVPDLIAESDGTLHAAWTEIGNASVQVVYSTRAVGGDWADPLVLSEDTGTIAAFPSLAVDGSGTLHAVWTEVGEPSTLVYKRRRPDGTWTGYLSTLPETLNPFRPVLVAGTGDELDMIWYDDDSQGRGVIYSHFDGSAWSRSLTLSTPLTDDMPLSLVRSEQGTLHALWTFRDGTASYGRLPQGGAWNIEPTGLKMFNHSLAVDAEDRPHAVWESFDSPNISYSYAEGTIWSEPETVATKEQPVVSAPEIALAHNVLTSFFTLSIDGPVYYSTRSLTTDTESPAAPTELVELSPGYPNPFSTSATVTFKLAVPADVTLEVVDVLGRTVQSLVDADMPPGQHEVVVDGRHLAPGSYTVRLRSGGRVLTRSLVHLR